MDGSERRRMAAGGSRRRQDAPPTSRRLTSGCPTVPPKVPQRVPKVHQRFLRGSSEVPQRVPKVPQRVTKVPKVPQRVWAGAAVKSRTTIGADEGKDGMGSGAAEHDGSSTGRQAEWIGNDQTFAARCSGTDQRMTQRCPRDGRGVTRRCSEADPTLPEGWARGDQALASLPVARIGDETRGGCSGHRKRRAEALLLLGVSYVVSAGSRRGEECLCY